MSNPRSYISTFSLDFQIDGTENLMQSALTRIIAAGMRGCKSFFMILLDRFSTQEMALEGFRVTI